MVKTADRVAPEKQHSELPSAYNFREILRRNSIIKWHE
jgi:hypothetical protein